MKNDICKSLLLLKQKNIIKVKGKTVFSVTKSVSKVNYSF